MSTQFLTQIFCPEAVPSIQYALLVMSEYVNENITTVSVAEQEGLLQAIQQTLFNMLHLIDASQIQNLLSADYNQMASIIGGLPLSSTDLTLINNRLIAMNSLINTIHPFPLFDTFNVNNLTAGNPAIHPWDLLSYFVQFNYETPPVGLTVGNFFTNIQAMATAWQNALDYLTSHGASFQMQSYNAVDRMSSCCQDVANFVNNMVLDTSLTSTQLTHLWNSIVALPAILRVADILYNDPSSQNSQSINTLKFAMYNLIFQTNAVLSAFTTPNSPQPATGILRSGESLLDFAARTLGDYSQWEAVATANALQPPYVGTTAAPGIATPGQQLYLPPFSINSAIPSYNDAYLGTDVDFGVPYGTMTNWTGDFTTISGMNNYVGALYRRVLTTLGNLIYHPSYGSLLPPQIGEVQTSNEALLLSAYLKSSLLTDPRTKTINLITAYPANFGQIIMTANLTPFGSTANIPLNLVITPVSKSVTK